MDYVNTYCRRTFIKIENSSPKSSQNNFLGELLGETNVKFT